MVMEKRKKSGLYGWKEKIRLYVRRLRDFWRLYSRSKMGVLGLAIFIFFLAIAIFAPYIAPYNPYMMGSGSPFQPPSFKHLLGTNNLGEDIFSELLYGSRVSLLVGVSVAAAACLIGTFVGLFAGYFGNWVDELLMRTTDVFLILPRIPLMMLLAAFAGPSLITIILVITIVSWTALARQIRSQVLSLKELQFVEASKATGSSHLRIIFSHILPNVWGIIMANMVLLVVDAIVSEASLSFLGLGDPTLKSWGMMLYYAENSGAFLRGSWWWVVAPGMCIVVIGCAFAFIGHTLNAVLNPKLRVA